MSKHNLDPDLIELSDKNPQDTLPFLDDNGYYLSESRAIIYYLVASKDPNSSLLGIDYKEQTVIMNRMHYELSIWSPLVPQVLGPIMQGEIAKISDEHVKVMQDAFNIIDRYLAKSRYVAGENVTIAEFSYVAWISTFIVRIFFENFIFADIMNTIQHLLQHIGFPILERYQNIARWYDKCNDLPGFEENDFQAKAVGTYVKERISEPIIFFD